MLLHIQKNLSIFKIFSSATLFVWHLSKMIQAAEEIAQSNGQRENMSDDFISVSKNIYCKQCKNPNQWLPMAEIQEHAEALCARKLRKPRFC